MGRGVVRLGGRLGVRVDVNIELIFFVKIPKKKSGAGEGGQVGCGEGGVRLGVGGGGQGGFEHRIEFFCENSKKNSGRCIR